MKRNYFSLNRPLLAAIRSWHLGRPVLFLAVGLVGLGVYMGVLAVLHGSLWMPFLASNITAVLIAMMCNFAVNNYITYGDRRLHGTAFFIGFFSFAVACSAGTLVNIIVAEQFYRKGFGWGLAGFVGALAGAGFNYLATAKVTWRSRR